MEFREPIMPYKGGYTDKFILKVLNHLKTGKSIASFAGSVGVTTKKVEKWMGEHEDFKEAVEIGQSMNLGAMEDMAIDQATGETKGNSSTLTFLLKNQHNEVYQDKQIIESEGNVVFQIATGVPDSLDELEANLPIEVESKVIEDDSDLL